MSWQIRSNARPRRRCRSTSRLRIPGIIGIDRYRYEPSGEAYNLYFEHPSTDLSVHEIVMYNPRGEQDFSSHAFDLLQLSPEQSRQQRGYFASQELARAKWRRFLFD